VRCKFLQCFIDKENVVVRCFAGHDDTIQINALPTASMTPGRFPPRAIHEQMPHCFGGHREEMSTIFP
jgi:hypothetical protein